MTGNCNVFGVKLGIIGLPGMIGVTCRHVRFIVGWTLALFPPGYTVTVCLVRVATASDGPILRPVSTVVLLIMRSFGRLQIWRHVLTILARLELLTVYLFMKRVATGVPTRLLQPLLGRFLTCRSSSPVVLPLVGT